jgi:hypothetical protein
MIKFFASKNSQKKNIFFWLLCLLIIQPSLTYSSVAYSEILVKDNHPNNQCIHNLETLTNLLLQDLPNYANRVIQSSRRSTRTIQTMPVYVIVAGKPEFEPIPLSQIQYQGIGNQPPEQVFFTTLERQYVSENKVIEAQNYHWLFLTQTASGWRMVMIFSRFDSSRSNQAPSPPRDSSNGIIGQAVKLWLRDCRAGAIN